MATSYGGPNPKPSGQDPRGRLQNQGGYMQKRFEQQQGPAVSEFARQFGRAAETQYGDYGDIMKRYGDIAGGAGSGMGKVSYDDPFKSYGGYEEFSKTGGYSPQDIANMRSRGTSPVRAAYAGAEREVGRQRALQGGYSPNAVAARVKMAREQGQGAADAMQNVEAGLAEAKNRGRLSGLGGMSNIEGQRLNAQLESGMFNARADQQDQLNKLNAVQGMSSLYGTTPGMAQLFGNQLNTSIGQGGTIGLGQQQADIQAQGLPGAFDERMNQINRGIDIFNRGTSIAYPFLNDEREQLPPGGSTGGYQPLETFDPNYRPPWQGPQQPYGTQQEPFGPQQQQGPYAGGYSRGQQRNPRGPWA